MATLVQYKSTAPSASPSSTYNTVFTSGVTAGNLIVVGLTASLTGFGRLASSITDDKGNTYTNINFQNSSNASTELWYCYNAIGGATTVTLHTPSTWAGGNTICIQIREYSGVVSSSNPLDKSHQANGSSTSLTSGATATTTQANELVVGLGISALNGQSYSAGSGFGNLQTFNTGANSNIAMEDMNVSSTGAQTATFTVSPTSWSYGAAVATFLTATTANSTVALSTTLEATIESTTAILTTLETHPIYNTVALFTDLLPIGSRWTTGPNSVVTPASDITSTGSGGAWTNPQNAGRSDGSYATTTSASSQNLQALDFGFSIPTTSVISGIQVDIERLATVIHPPQEEIFDITVQLVKGGTASGNNYAQATLNWPGTDTYESYGSPSDLWGLSLNPSDINASNFGVILSVSVKDIQITGNTAEVDHMRITVSYITFDIAMLTTLETAPLVSTVALSTTLSATVPGHILTDLHQDSTGSNFGNGQFSGVRYRGEGFTQQHTGYLTKIAFDRNKGSQDLKVYIDNADSNYFPIHAVGSELYSFTIPNASVINGYGIYTLPTPVILQAGQRYCWYIAPWSISGNAYTDDYQDNHGVSSLTSNTQEITNNTGTWSQETLTFHFANIIEESSNVALSTTLEQYGKSPAYSGYSYGKEIVILANQITGTLSYFPVLIKIVGDPNLKTVANGGHVQNSNGYDIIFVDVDAQILLTSEIEFYDGVAGTIIAWVSIPSLSSSANKTLEMFYGNPNVSAPLTTANQTWDSNYKAVFHMNQDPSGTAPQLKDSTVNANNLTTQNSMTSAELVTGIINKAIDFNQPSATTQYANKTDAGAGDTLRGGGVTDMMIELWFNADSLPNNEGFPISKYHYGTSLGYAISLGSAGQVNWKINGGSHVLSSPNSEFTTGNWYYLVCTLVGGTDQYIYLNNVQIAHTSFTALTLSAASDNFDLAEASDAEGNAGFTLRGKLAEVRVTLGSSRSTAWSTTAYNNQSNPSGFIIVENEQNYTATTTALLTTLEAPVTIAHQIDIVQGDWSTTSTSWGLVPNYWKFTRADYSGAIEAYVQVTILNKSGVSGSAQLYDITAGAFVNNTSVSTTSSTFATGQTTTDISNILIDGHEYAWAITSSVSGDETDIIAGRIIIKQKMTVPSSKTLTHYVAIGISESITGAGTNSYQTVADQPIVLFDTTWLDGTVTTYFEATIDTSGSTTSDITYAQLYDKTAASAVSGSQVQINGTTTDKRQRSGAITLTSGHEYVVQIKQAVTTDTASLRNAFLIINQAGATKTEFQQVINNSLGTGTNTGFLSFYAGMLYNYGMYSSVVMAEDYFEATMKSSNAAGQASANIYDVTQNLVISGTASITGVTYARNRASEYNFNSNVGLQDYFRFEAETNNASYTYSVVSPRVISHYYLESQNQNTVAIYTFLEQGFFSSTTALSTTLETYLGYINGNALLFDGSQNYGLLTSTSAINIAGLTAWSFIVFVKWTVAQRGNILNLMFNFGQNRGIGFYIQDSGGALQTYVGNTGYGTSLTISQNIPVALGVTWDGTTLRQYVGGVKDNGVNTPTFHAGVTSDASYVGQEAATFNNFGGIIDKLRVYANRTLTDTEMANFANGFDPTINNIVLKYDFSEGLGTTSADSSGNNNTLTLSGSPIPKWVMGIASKSNNPIALLTTFEVSAKYSTTALLTTLESNVFSTLALLTTLESHAIYNTFSLSTTLERIISGGKVILDRTATIITSSTNNAGTTVSWPHPVTPNQVNTILVISLTFWLNGGTAGGASSATYNSIAMTNAGNGGGNGEVWSEQWYLINPPSGTNNVVVTMGTNTTRFKAASYSFINVDTNNPIDGAHGSGGTGSSILLSFSLSHANEYVVDSLAHFSANAPTSYSDIAVLNDTTSGVLGFSQYGFRANSGSQSTSITMPDTGDAWEYAVLALSPVNLNIALLTELESSGQSTVGILTIFEEVVKNTTALLTILEEFPIYKTLALLTTLQSTNQFSTFALSTTLEKVIKGAVYNTISKDYDSTPQVNTGTNASFTITDVTTTQVNEVLVLYNASPVNQISTISGAGLTWNRKRLDHNQGAYTEIWWAYAASIISSQTITVTMGTSGGTNQITFSELVSYINANITNPFGNNGANSATTGAPSLTILASQLNTWPFMVGVDMTAASTIVADSNNTILGQTSNSSKQFWVEYSNVHQVTGQNYILGTTSPTSDTWTVTGTEIVPSVMFYVTVPLSTTLETYGYKTVPLLTVLETHAIYNTVALKTILEATKLSTTALLTTIELTNNSTVALFTDLSGPTVVYSTTGLITVLESYPTNSTTALLTTLQSANQYSTIALLTILETAGQPSTIALLTTLEATVPTYSAIDLHQDNVTTSFGFGQFNNVRYRGEGFTPSYTGYLTAIAFNRNKPSQDVKIYIDNADSNYFPTHILGLELESFTVPNNQITGGYQVFKLPTPIYVVAGQKYCWYVAPWSISQNKYVDDFQNFNGISSLTANTQEITNTSGTWSQETLTVQFANYIQVATATALLTTLESHATYNTVALKVTLESANQFSTVALYSFLEATIESTVALSTILEAVKENNTAILTTLEEFPIYSTVALLTTLESNQQYSTIGLNTILESHPIYSTIAIRTVLEEHAVYSTVALLTFFESYPNVSVVALRTTLETAKQYLTVAILTTFESTQLWKTVALNTTLEGINFGTIALYTPLESVPTFNTVALVANLSNIQAGQIGLLTIFEVIPQFRTLALSTTLESTELFSTIAFTTELETTILTTIAINTILETTDIFSTIALNTVLEKYPVYSTVAINTLLESAAQFNTVALLTTIESYVIYSTIAIQTILESHVTYGTIALNTILEEHAVFSTLALNTTLETSNIYSTIAIGTILESAKQYTTIAITVMLEATINGNIALLTIVEEAKRYSTVALHTDLEFHQIYSATALFTELQKQSMSTVALQTILESLAQYLTVALITILEGNGYSTVAIYAPLEATIENTVALQTVLESLPQYTTIALKTTLEVKTDQTIALLANLVKIQFSTIGMSANLLHFIGWHNDDYGHLGYEGYTSNKIENPTSPQATDLYPTPMGGYVDDGSNW